MDNSSSTKINFSSSGFRKYLANTGWMFFEKILRILLAFTVNIFLARYLGPSDYGLFNYVLSFTGLFMILSSFGIEVILTRELVQSPEKANELLGTGFRLRIFGSFLSILLTIIVALLIGEPLSTLILIIIFSSSTIFQSMMVVEQYFQAKVEAKKNVIAQSLSFFLLSLLKIIFILTEQPLVLIVFAHTSEFIFLSIGYYIIYSKTGNKLNSWYFNLGTAKTLFKDSWPLMLSGLVISIYMKIDQVMIKNMMTSADVGYYAVAVKLSEAWYFIPMTISASLFPAIIKAKSHSEEFYLNRIQKLYDLLAAIAIGIAIPITIFSDLIIKIIFGASFMPASTVLTIYIWAGVGTFLGVASSQYLISENLTKLAFYRTLIGMIVNVLLNIFLIPKYGINGAAFATLVSYTLATFSIGISRVTYKQMIMMIKSVFLINLIKELYKYASNSKRKS